MRSFIASGIHSKLNESAKDTLIWSYVSLHIELSSGTADIYVYAGRAIYLSLTNNFPIPIDRILLKKVSELQILIFPHSQHAVTVPQSIISNGCL